MSWYSAYVASGKCELYARVAATPKSLTDSANPIASADQMAGASIGTISRMASIRLAPCTRAASSNSCPRPARAAVTARKLNGTERRPSSRTTPNGPMIACVTNGRFRPTRYMTPSAWTSRSQPSAGSHDGSSSTSHIPPAAHRRPGSVVRPASQAIGNPMARPSAAAAQLTHSELATATAVAPVNVWCR